MAYSSNRNNTNQQQPFSYLQSQGDTAIKYVNIVMSLFLIIAGGVAIGIGSWLALWTYQIRDLEVFTGSDIYVSSYVLLIIAGILLIVICLVGCCGANQENNGLLIPYLIVVIISLFMLLIVGILGFVFNEQLSTTISTNYTTAIVKYYGVNLNNQRNKEITDAIDRIQATFECCGVSGNLNSSNSWYIYRSQSVWHQLLYGGTNPPMVPVSCCKRQQGSTTTYLDQDQCQGTKAFSSSTRGTAAPLNPPPVTVTNTYLFQDGCITAMTSRIYNFSMMLGGVGIGLMIFLIICVVVGCLLVKAVEDGQYAYKHSKSSGQHVSNEAKKSQYSAKPGDITSTQPGTSRTRPTTEKPAAVVENSPALTRSTGFGSEDEFDA